MAQSEKEIKTMLCNLKQENFKAGLQIRHNKTKAMINGSKHELIENFRKVKYVEEFKNNQS